MIKVTESKVAGQRFEPRQSAPLWSILDGSLAPIQIHTGHQATSRHHSGISLVPSFVISYMLHGSPSVTSSTCSEWHSMKEKGQKNGGPGYRAEVSRTMGGRRDSDSTSVYGLLFLSYRELSAWSWWFSLAASFCLDSSSLQRSLLGKGSISTLFNSSLETPTKSQ